MDTPQTIKKDEEICYKLSRYTLDDWHEAYTEMMAHAQSLELSYESNKKCSKLTHQYGYLPEAKEAADKVPSESVLEALKWTATYLETLESRLGTLYYENPN